MDKSDSAYKTIGEVAKILKLKSNKNGILPTHTIRFWETQFKQIKPKILNANRRYYDENCINLLKKVKFLQLSSRHVSPTLSTRRLQQFFLKENSNQ
mgnify:CR=1 FL=1